MCRAGDVPHPAAWPRVIPVKHHDRVVLPEDRVVGRPVVVANELMPPGRDLMPRGVRWRPERPDGIVITAGRVGGARQPRGAFCPTRRARPGPATCGLAR